jgi:hypothetical protein
MTQPTLFDVVPSSPGAARRVRDEALTRVSAHATPGFLEVAVAAIKVVAQRQQFLTTDEVMKQIANLATTPDLRALGPCMTKAMKLRYIAPTDRVRNTERASRHAAPVRIWESLLWGRNDG